MEFIEYIQSTSQLGPEHSLNNGFDWIFWSLMLFNVIALAYVRTALPGYITILIRTGVYNRQLYQNVQEGLRLNSVGSVFLTLGYLNCFAVLVQTFIPDSPGSMIWILLATGGIVLLVKFSLIRFLGFLTEVREGLTEHWINHLIYFQIITLVLTPLLCLTHFAPQTVQPVIGITIASFMLIMILLREVQSFVRALRQRVPVVYIILYLCTLELIPLIVLIKVLVR
ncbi:MAG: DUF4271 domain-containing protein [Crocinitomicaceae bacterium]|jgi:uncharacterized membrane protein YpjA|nr:DUF4271 domain-containing protein [Crocinitomicaceae bacterium]MBK6953766.1 DUF4271 domain-containing protein [Crocinitomicaceae bacterium]MBK9593511.1 DUF4271 domain-containing protein [Crocinitomicaceae bacterium]